MNISISFKNSA